MAGVQRKAALCESIALVQYISVDCGLRIREPSEDSRGRKLKLLQKKSTTHFTKEMFRRRRES
jgi:hypothetical protein